MRWNHDNVSLILPLQVMAEQDVAPDRGALALLVLHSSSPLNVEAALVGEHGAVVDLLVLDLGRGGARETRGSACGGMIGSAVTRRRKLGIDGYSVLTRMQLLLVKVEISSLIEEGARRFNFR